MKRFGPLLLVLFLSAPAALALPIHTGEAATVYLPDDLKPSEVLPVVLVEQGLAQTYAKLWPTLSRRMRLIVVETGPLRELVKHPDATRRIEAALEDALREAASLHDVNRCPWVVIAFSAAAPQLGYATLRRPRLFQGLILVNSGLRERDLPPNLEQAKAVPVAILHGLRDPGVPVERARAMEQALKRAGFRVHLEVIDTNKHNAPLGEEGAPALAKYLESLGTDPVTTRRVPVAPQTIETASSDGLRLTADLYETGDKSDPILLLFHQARSSRGEYREIAPRLVDAGFNCLALDQRSGGEWAGVANETAQRAADASKPQAYVDAKPDLVRAVAWARELGFKGKLGLIGSSYSSSLVIFLASELEGIDAVVSFSPGDYLPPKGSIFEAAGKVELPVLVHHPVNETERATAVFKALRSDHAVRITNPGDVHGASTLYRSPRAERVWKALLGFLEEHLKPAPEDEEEVR